MFFKSFNLIFSMTLMMGTIIAVSSNSWFTAWLGLELNLMSMIPLILISLSSKMTDSAIKYFLVQAFASIIMIFSATFNFIFINSISLELMEILMISSIMLKLGAAPFHMWFPQIVMNLNWIQTSIILTWQKVAPFFLIMSLTSKYLILLAIVSALIGALSGFNLLIMKLILTYSSISHTGWMLSACFLNFNYWVMYFFMYSVLSLSIILFFFSSNITKINQIFLTTNSTFLKFVAIFNILSLGGLPPLMGFNAKLSIILIIIKKSMMLIFLSLILASLISLFFYTRILYSSMMNFNKTMKTKYYSSKPLILMSFMTSFLNILTPALFFMI